MLVLGHIPMNRIITVVVVLSTVGFLWSIRSVLNAGKEELRHRRNTYGMNIA